MELRKAAYATGDARAEVIGVRFSLDGRKFNLHIANHFAGASSGRPQRQADVISRHVPHE
ncbi:MAG: hypothetical protein IPP45_00845 [Sphingomonadales bacterium]|nr:hypothetical protein [Sphingomonadales bacterium]